MPIYTYKCPECDVRTSIDHPMMDESERLCEICKSSLKKLPGVGAVAFKGSGWGKDAR